MSLVQPQIARRQQYIVMAISLIATQPFLYWVLLHLAGVIQFSNRIAEACYVSYLVGHHERLC